MTESRLGQFLSRHSAPGDRVALQDLDLHAGASQVSRGDQSIVARADDDDVTHVDLRIRRMAFVIGREPARLHSRD